LANEQYHTHGGSVVAGEDKSSDDITFWEVDHPSTGRVKERGLHRLLQSPNSVKCLHVDLTQHKLSDILPTTLGYDCNEPTMVVVEGLTYYLQAHVLYNLFDEIAKVVGPKSRIVFDFFVTSTSDDGRPEICHSPFINGLLLNLVQLVGEPLYFSCGSSRRRQYTTSPTTTALQQTHACTSARRRGHDSPAVAVNDNADDDDDDDYNMSIAQDLSAFFRIEEHKRQHTPYWKVVTPVQAVGFERLVVVELTQPQPPPPP
jgi:hypothetical protein